MRDDQPRTVAPDAGETRQEIVEPRPESRIGTWLHRIPTELVSALEIVLLGLLALILVLRVIPRAFGIESSCVGEAGLVTNPGYVYVGAFAVLGTLGWVGVFLATVCASIAGRRDIVVLLPGICFVVLVVSAVIAAAIFGPAPCPQF